MIGPIGGGQENGVMYVANETCQSQSCARRVPVETTIVIKSSAGHQDNLGTQLPGYGTCPG